jgi:hypothetical protein
VLYSRLSAWLSAPGAATGIALAAFLLSLPAIGMGLVGDDYDMAAAVAKGPFSAYSFWPRDAEQGRLAMLHARDVGTVAWWASDDFRQSFMRPLASLSHALDFALFRDAPWLMHVENSALYAAIVLLSFAVYRALGLSALPLGLATFFYAFNGHHSMTVGWISGRNTLLAVVFGLLAIALHLRARAHESRTSSVLAAASFGLALLSAEGGVAAFGYLLAHALVLDQGPLRARLLRLWPYALVIVAWRVAYAAGGYGVAHSGFYRDPGTDPVGFLIGVAHALPIYLASQLTVPYASMAAVTTRALVIATLLSLALLYALRGLVLPLLHSDARARFLGLGAALAIVPLGTTVPQDRLVFFVGVGTCGLLALIMQSHTDAQGALGKRSVRVLWTLHGLVNPALFVAMLFGTMSQVAGGGALALDRALPLRADAHVVLLNGPSHLPVHFQRRMRAFRGESRIPRVDMLYAGASNAVVRRVSETTLELAVERDWLGTIGALTRDLSRAPFRAGEVLSRPRMRITILEVTARGGPKRMRFELQPDPDRQLLFYAWRGRTPAPIALPPVGESLMLRGVSPI